MYRITDDEFFGGMIEPSVITASSGAASGLSGLLGPIIQGGSSILSGLLGLFRGRSGGEKASDYTSRMLNEYIQNPERATSLYNKNTDLTNPFCQSLCI